MAIVLSPKPSDGPLNGQAASVSIVITTPIGGTVAGAIKVPGRPPIEVPVTRLSPGSTRVVVQLPRGGVPRGATLSMVVMGADLDVKIANYNSDSALPPQSSRRSARSHATINLQIARILSVGASSLAYIFPGVRQSPSETCMQRFEKPHFGTTGQRVPRITRRTAMISCMASLLSVAAFPCLPSRSRLTPEALFDPGVARAIPVHIRELCLEFYDHPTARYRMAAAVLMAEFRNATVQAALSRRVAIEPVVAIRQRAIKSLIQHQDPQTYATIARLYSSDPSVRSQVDARVRLFGLTALQEAIRSGRL